MIRRPPRSTPLYSSAASDVYKRQVISVSVETLPFLRHWDFDDGVGKGVSAVRVDRQGCPGGPHQARLVTHLGFPGRGSASCPLGHIWVGGRGVGLSDDVRRYDRGSSLPQLLFHYFVLPSEDLQLLLVSLSNLLGLPSHLGHLSLERQQQHRLVGFGHSLHASG